MQSVLSNSLDPVNSKTFLTQITTIVIQQTLFCKVMDIFLMMITQCCRLKVNTYRSVTYIYYKLGVLIPKQHI